MLGTEKSLSIIQATAQVPSGDTKPQQTMDEAIQQLQKAIDAIQGPQKTLEFSIHEKTNTVMIKVLNKETGDLIREVPPEKILDLAARMMEITGFIIDEKV
ncbi:flagellar protein FlaG [Paenibacillus algicola]|uniref:Flagellar protein FlaG n=2 Tax=Paenibacillus algicola TaxID=2565926 RepID=A0A4P8XNU9_9BACL|nr:flagellar protein FlaG [Paenibacillus algicola]